MNEVTTTQPRAVSAAAESDVQRAVAEVQASVMLAKKFPRDVHEAISYIMEECGRPALAEVAIYDYAKGGTSITGGSIRLIEVIALNWGNIQSGWRELDRTMINGVMYSEIEAFAWDMERVRRESVTFKVKLTRDTRSGSYPLKDEREIYEHCANMAARRKRSCIEALIPGYVKEQAIAVCRDTIAQGITKDTVPNLLKAFDEKFGVSQEEIEAFIQRDIISIQPTQVVRLREVFNSLKDGVASREDFFKPVVEQEKKPEGKGNSALKDKLKKSSSSQTQPSEPDGAEPPISEENSEPIQSEASTVDDETGEIIDQPTIPSFLQ